MTTPSPDAIERLLTEARMLLAVGDPGAERILGTVTVMAPTSTEAWVLLARCAQSRGDAMRALECMQTACRLDPNNPLLLCQLGVAAAAAGYLDEALQALRFASGLAPGLHVARLRIGQVLEAKGDRHSAIRAYMRALIAAQLDGKWLNEEAIPAGLRAAVTHAAQVAREGRVEIIRGLLDPLLECYGHMAMRRVERSLLGYLELETCLPSDPQQRPKFLYCPDLPSSAYLERELFPWFDALEAGYPQIRAEAQRVLEAPDTLKPFLNLGAHDDPSAYLAGTEDGAARWDAFFFYRYGSRYADHHLRCPRTASILEALPLVRIAEHAPEICFSVLAPGTHILPHHGVTNVRVVVHLPLIVPPDCALRVAGQDHAWQEGRCVAFDDTFLHEAWNRSGEPRAILLMDAWNPHLTEVERIAFTAIIEGIGAVNRG
jgi:aspartate beta-hydroxylase